MKMKYFPPWTISLVALAPLGIAACYGAGSGDEGSSSGSQGGPNGTDSGIVLGPAVGTDQPAAVPFAHLTAAQYQNTIADLFAPLTVPAPSAPADIVVGGFDNNAGVQVPSAALLEAYHNGAVAVANAAMKTADKLLGCTPATRADEDACATKFLNAFAKKAYRRPLDPGEGDDLVAFYTSRRTTGDDFPTAMTLAIEAVLQSPHFLYHVEIGKPVDGKPNVMHLGGFEMASRLSYLLWNTMPDDALMTAAESGQLDAVAGIETQARRLLADAKAHAAIARFHRGWLRFDVMKDMTKDPGAFPNFNANVGVALSQSAEKFVDGVFFNKGTLTTFFTDTNAWVNDQVAPIFGVAAPGSTDLKLVPVDATQRAGILTHPGLMAGFAHNLQDSPVLRGVFVLSRFLCAPPPSPPPGVATTPPQPDTGKPRTTRDIFASNHEQGGCATCHHAIDGIGFSFEHYDAVGQYRTQDNGLPVDSSGWFPDGLGDLSGTFKDAVELGHKLSSSQMVQACFVSQWMRYALGVDQTGVDFAMLRPLATALKSGNMPLSEFVVELAKSDGFHSRLIEN